MGRLGGGVLSAYLGNRSEAEIDDQREPEGWSKATSNLSDMRPWESLNQWMRSRMRLYYWKQWGRPRTRRRKLMRLGIGREEVHKASRSRKGPWRISHTSIVHRAMTIEWLESQGLPRIEKQWSLIRYPHGRKKTSRVTGGN